MVCCLGSKNKAVHSTAYFKRPRCASAQTLEKAVRAAEMFRRGFTLAKIGDAFGCSREWARQILKVARWKKIMEDNEYYLLKGRAHYDSAQKRWGYFCDLARNIWNFNRDKYMELRSRYWSDGNSATRARYAEKSCLEMLVRKGSIARSDAKIIDYLLFKFKHRNDTPAKLVENAEYFMKHKELSLKDFALKRGICNTTTNPAAITIRHIILAIELGIISPDDYALRALANFYSVFSTVRKPVHGSKYPEHKLKFVIKAHEKTGLPYSKIADFSEVPVKAVYEYKRRMNNKTALKQQYNRQGSL